MSNILEKFMEYFTVCIDNGDQVDIAYLDFSRLMQRLSQCGLMRVHSWME